jgi:hypothetical protein
MAEHQTTLTENPLNFQMRFPCGTTALCCRAGVFLLWYIEQCPLVWQTCSGGRGFSRGYYGSRYSFA